MSTEKPTAKKIWPDAPPFPADARPVPGIRPERRAYQFNHPKYGPTYVCRVEFKEIPTVERIKQEVGEETGQEVKTRNIKFKNPETKADEWWTGCSLSFLRRLDSWKPPANELSEVVVPTAPIQQAANKKTECTDVIKTHIEKMEGIIETQLGMVDAGDYIPFGKTPAQLKMALKVQRATLKALKAQFGEALLTCPDEI